MIPPARTPIPTAAELAQRLGPLPLHRLSLDVPLGTATAADVLRLHEAGRHVELVDGVLIAKPDSERGTSIAERLRGAIESTVAERETGLVGGTNVLLRLAPTRFRLANVILVDVPRPAAERREERILSEFPPTLAVEVLSPDHTGKEMEDKLRDYFTAGTRLVWYVYPQARSVHVYPSLEEVEMLTETDTLDGGDVLPGLSIELRRLFDA